MNTTTSGPQASDHTETHTGPGAQGGWSGYNTRPLARSAHDRMLAGVAGGMARYLGVDATLVRIGLAVLTVIGGAGIPLYLAGWLLIPDEGCDQSLASQLIQSLQGGPR